MAIGAPAVTIEDLGPEHWPEVGRIYADGIATGDATISKPARSCTRRLASFSGKMPVWIVQIPAAS